MILTDVSDTLHADSLTLFALNIEILLADVTKPVKWKILSLTWPVTSSVTSRSNIWPCTGSSRTQLGLDLKFGNRSSSFGDLRGAFAPPPQQDVLLTRLQRGEGYVQYSTKVFGALEPLSRFLAISPKQMQISTPNFQHTLSHQFHTLCKKLKVQGMTGRPQMTSEWHHVPSISTLPRTQFLSYGQLAYMTCRRISSAIKLLSRIFF